VFLWSRILSSRKSQFRAFSSGNLGFPDAVQSYQTEVLQTARQLQEVGVGRIGLEDFLGVESTKLGLVITTLMSVAWQRGWTKSTY
jgi:hypothetical protein